MRVRTFSKQVMKQTESSDKYGEKNKPEQQSHWFDLHFPLQTSSFASWAVFKPCLPAQTPTGPDVFKRLLHLNICSYLTPCIKKTMKDLTSAHLSFLIHIKPSPPPDRILSAKTKQKRKMKTSFGEGREKI